MGEFKSFLKIIGICISIIAAITAGITLGFIIVPVLTVTAVIIILYILFNEPEPPP